jgi:hypothetical protein
VLLVLQRSAEFVWDPGDRFSKIFANFMRVPTTEIAFLFTEFHGKSLSGYFRLFHKCNFTHENIATDSV